MISDRIKAIKINEQASLRRAMEAIDLGACEIAFILDHEERLLGTLTDGDIRRAILAGASLEELAAQFMNRNFTFVTDEMHRVDVLDLMKARSLQQIPVIDEKGRFVGLHLLREMLGAVPRENWAVIMAGGRGERLRPLTDSLPKPMVKVAGRPILERIILHLVGFGIQRIFLSINYLGEIIQDYFGNGSAFGCRIEYLKEDKPLGTGGALSLLPDRPSQPFFVLNGDLVTQFDVDRMLRFHSSGNFMATMAVYEYLYTVPYGVVQISEDCIKSIHEKPTYTWMTNAGIYLFDPSLLERIPKDNLFPLPVLFEDCLDRGEPVGAFHLVDDWADIGRHEELRKACGKV